MPGVILCAGDTEMNKIYGPFSEETQLVQETYWEGMIRMLACGGSPSSHLFNEVNDIYDLL